jgi:hypothetical protein
LKQRTWHDESWNDKTWQNEQIVRALIITIVVSSLS